MSPAALGNTIFFPLAGVDSGIVRRVQKAWRRLLRAGEASGWMLIEADREPTEDLMAQIAKVSKDTATTATSATISSATISSDTIIIISGDPQQGRLIAATALRTGLIPVIIGRPDDYRPVITHLYNGIIISEATVHAITTALMILVTEPRRRFAIRNNNHVIV